MMPSARESMRGYSGGGRSSTDNEDRAEVQFSTRDGTGNVSISKKY